MRALSVRNLLLCLIAVSSFGCSKLPFVGGDEDKPRSRISMSFAVPAELEGIAESDLFADMTIYDNKRDLKVIQEADLKIENGLVQFEEYNLPQNLTDAEVPVATQIVLPPDTQKNEIRLITKRNYTFAITFKVHQGQGVLLPVAYIRKTVSFTKPADILTFLAPDFTYSNPGTFLNDLSVSFNIDGIDLANLDSDGDTFSNLDEVLDRTDPNDSTIFPTPGTARCGNGLVNVEEACDDGNTSDADTCNASCQKAPPVITVISPQAEQSVRDTVIILAEASSEWGVRSLALRDPSGIEDRDFSSETFQGVWDTTHLPEDQNVDLVLTGRDDDGRERTRVVPVRVNNTPDILSFGPGATINVGSSHTLTWAAANFSTLAINNLDGGERRLFTATGSTIVSPTVTTTYTLTATRTNSQGQSFTLQRQVTVAVNNAPSLPALISTPSLLSSNPVDNSFTWNASVSGSASPACSAIVYSLIVQYPSRNGVRGATVFTAEDLTQPSFNTATLTAAERLQARSDYEVQITATDNCGLSSSTAFIPFATGDAGLVGWWRFEDSGNLGRNTANPVRHTGVLTDNHPADGTHLPTQTNGPTAESDAIRFANFDPYLDLGTDAGLRDITSEITVELWINPSVSKDAYVASHGNLSDGWVVYQSGTTLQVRVSSAATTSVTTLPNTLALNAWSFVSFSYDGERVRVYVNGILRETPPLTGAIDYAGTTRTLLAASESDMGALPPNNRFFKGSIDEFAVYNRALSSAEMRANCRRNDSANQCVPVGAPEPIYPINNSGLAPNRAYIAWSQPDRPANRTISNYTLCYVANGNISGPDDCLNSRVETQLRHVIPGTLVTNSAYSWKVRANYTDGSRSAYSPVWLFNTDNSLIRRWDFAGEPNGVANLNSASITDTGALPMGAQTGVSVEVRARVRDFAASFVPAAIVSGGGADGWLVQVTNNPGNIQCRITTGGAGDGQFVASTGFVTEDYNHVVCSYGQAQGAKRIYINTLFGDNPGTDIDEAAATGLLNYSSATVTLGGDPYSTLAPFNGFLDEVAVYNRPLSTDELRNNFCALEVQAGTTPLPENCR